MGMFVWGARIHIEPHGVLDVQMKSVQNFFLLSWTPAADAWLGAYLCEFWWGILTSMRFDHGSQHAWNCFRAFVLNGWKSMRFKTMKYHHVVNLRNLKEARACWEEIQTKWSFLGLSWWFLVRMFIIRVNS